MGPNSSEGSIVTPTVLSLAISLLAIDPVRINKKDVDRNEHERIL